MRRSPSGSARRSQAFRQTHQVGDVVQGLVLRMVGPGHCWIEIDGQRLLASVNGTYAQGATLAFRILELSPHIMLEHLKGQRGASPLAPTVHEIISLRAGFEARLAALSGWQRRDTPGGRKRAFFASLAGDDDALFAWSRLLVAQASLNHLLASRGVLFMYMPWLLPDAREHECVATGPPPDGDGLWEAVYGFITPQAGRCRLHLYAKPPRSSFRIYAEDVSAIAPVADRIHALAEQTAGPGAEFIGVRPLPPQPAAGLLAPWLSG